MYEKQQFSAYLKRKRIAAGLSQAEVSRRLGYTSSQFVSNWERGLAKPPLPAMSKLIKLYSIDADEVLDHYLSATKNRLQKVLRLVTKHKRKK